MRFTNYTNWLGIYLNNTRYDGMFDWVNELIYRYRKNNQNFPWRLHIWILYTAEANVIVLLGPSWIPCAHMCILCIQFCLCRTKCHETYPFLVTKPILLTFHLFLVSIKNGFVYKKVCDDPAICKSHNKRFNCTHKHVTMMLWSKLQKKLTCL